MPGNTKLLIVVGAATPPGRLAAAMAIAAEAARGQAGGVAADILNLAETRIEICDGRGLDAYDEPTRQAVEAEQHVHHSHVESHLQVRGGGGLWISQLSHGQ